MSRNPVFSDRVVQTDTTNAVNRIVFSRYEQFQAATVCKGYSLKYVLSGQETYHLDKRRLQINPGQFLMVNDAQEVAVEISAPEKVRGLCVFMSQELLDEVYGHAQLSVARQLEADPKAVSRPFPGIFSFRYQSAASSLGQYLEKLAVRYQEKISDGELTDKRELYRLGELLLAQQQLQQEQMGGLQARKTSTREELYRRLNLGRDFLLDHWDQSPRIPDAAREAALSEYHFYRLFRQAFGLSPVQFLHQYRLTKAWECLTQTQLSITQIAESCGFYDVHHFNKTFRKHFGQGPSGVR